MHRVYDGARALGFPLIDLVLGLQMHLAPRRLHYSGAVSAQICSFQSILAGSALAISFTKALLLEPLSQLVAADSSVEQTVYVDDFSQTAVGNLYEVFSNLSIAGGQFASVAKQLCLEVSPKTTVVASHPLIERVVSARLHAASVPHVVKATARDLGVQLTLRKGRRTGILQSRLKASGQRLRAISRLVKLDKAARKLSTSGALPQAFWGG